MDHDRCAAGGIQPAPFFAANWKVDAAKAKVGFSVKGPFGKVHGSFTGLKSTIRFDEHDLAGSSVEASIDAKTGQHGHQDAEQACGGTRINI